MSNDTDTGSAPREENATEDVSRELVEAFAQAAGELGVQVPGVNIPAPEAHLPAIRTATELSAEPANKQQVATYLRQALERIESGGPDDDVFDALSLAVAANQVEPLLARIKYRNDIQKMVTQLSANTRALTSIAQMIRVEYDGSPVVADPNFANWDVEHMRGLVSRIQAQIDLILQREHDSVVKARNLEARCSNLEQRIEQMAAAHQQALSSRENETKHYREAILEANTHLTNYFDTQSFVVAQVDTTTGAPERFLKIVRDEDGDETYKSVNEWKKATRFSVWQRAQNIRARLVKMLRSSRPKVEHEEIGEKCQTFQVCLRRVTHEDFE